MFVSKTFRLGVLAAIIVFGTMYIVQTNSVSTKGYVMNDLEQRIEELEYENRKLEVQIAQHQSMSAIQSRLESMEFVHASSPEYVTLVDHAVARR